MTHTPHAALAGGRPLGRWAAVGAGVLALVVVACGAADEGAAAGPGAGDANADGTSQSATAPPDPGPGSSSDGNEDPGDSAAGETAGDGEDGSTADDPAADRSTADREERDGQVEAVSTAPPVRVSIERLGVDAEVIPLDLRDDGTIEVPPDHADVGWYRSGAAPGEAGPTVLGAHVDWDGRPGVFRHLDRLAAGDRIEVADADGTAMVYEVTHLDQHRKDAFPTFEVYGGTADDTLRLVTCGGPFLAEQRSHRDKLVAYATAVV